MSTVSTANRWYGGPRWYGEYTNYGDWPIWSSENHGPEDMPLATFKRELDRDKVVEYREELIRIHGPENRPLCSNEPGKQEDCPTCLVLGWLNLE